MDPLIILDCSKSIGDIISLWLTCLASLGTFGAFLFLIFQYKKTSKEFSQSSFQSTFNVLLNRIQEEGTNEDQFLNKQDNVSSNPEVLPDSNFLWFFEQKYFLYLTRDNCDKIFKEYLEKSFKQWKNPFKNTFLAFELIIANKHIIDDLFYAKTVIFQFDERNQKVFIIYLVCLKLYTKTDSQILDYIINSGLYKKLQFNLQEEGPGKEMWKSIEKFF